MALFSTEMGVGIAQDETNGGKEITLAGPIATDDDIVLGRKRLNDRLVLVASQKSGDASLVSSGDNLPFEALDDDLLDVHIGRRVTR